MRQPRYALVTSAHDEEAHIARTIESVLSQTVLPEIWIIVDDRSTDATGDIINRYAARCPRIRCLVRTGDTRHDFGGKVSALNEALDSLGAVEADFIGVLDADVIVPPRYFELVLGRFLADVGLGVAGGLIVEYRNGRKWRQTISIDSSVAGAVQMFRRECLQQIGRFPYLPLGSEDAAMEIMARRHGWRVQTFADIEVEHAGFVGSRAGSVLRVKLRRGMSYYDVGYHPLFQVARSLMRVGEWPVGGSLLESVGFFYRWARGERPKLPEDVVRFLRSEQMARLHNRVAS